MTSEQTQRMTAEQHADNLDAWADREAQHQPTGELMDAAKCLREMSSDLAAMTERAERAENSASALDEVACVLNRELRKTEDDLTEAREQLAEAVAYIDGIPEMIRELMPFVDRAHHKKFLQLSNIIDGFKPKTLSPSPKQTAGGGEG